MIEKAAELLGLINSDAISDDAWGDVFCIDASDIYNVIREEVSISNLYKHVKLERRDRFLSTLLETPKQKEIDFAQSIFDDLDDSLKLDVSSYVSGVSLSEDFKEKIYAYLSSSSSPLASTILKSHQVKSL